MPSIAAASRALAPSREARPTISDTSPRCIAGITFSVAMLATPSTLHFILRMVVLPVLRLRRRHAPLGLPGQHPARIFGLQRAHLIEGRNVLRAKRQFRGGEIVVELFDRLCADDDAHDALALDEPREGHARDRRV